jgi:hypothetical protein
MFERFRFFLISLLRRGSLSAAIYLLIGYLASLAPGPLPWYGLLLAAVVVRVILRPLQMMIQL